MGKLRRRLAAWIDVVYTAAMPKETALPLAFMARMAVLLDEEFPQFLACVNQTPAAGLRVNTLKLPVDAFRALSPWALTPVAWCPQGFLLERKVNAGTHAFHDMGLYYVQDPSAMAVGALAAAQPGERVLDLCAAPGGKSTHLACLLAGQGVLVSNDVERSRAEVLRYNLERWGATNAVVLNETPERLAARWPGAFDCVVVDAPCSGEGMFRKNTEARFYWSDAHVAGCAWRQNEILQAAAALVRPGGRLVYATCTFSPEEDEGALWRFLMQQRDFELVQPPVYEGFAPGRPEWADWPANDPEQVFVDEAKAQLRRAVRLWPHLSPGEGHFVAVMRRGGEAAPAAWASPAPARLAASDRQALEAFWQPLIDRPLPDTLLLRPRDADVVEMLAPTPGAPDTAGLRALASGWRLGVLRKGRFEPSHALAMALRSHEVQHRLDEAVGSEAITRYLRGETLPISGPDGWLLLTLAGFPVGWGKRSRDVVKNHYPRALRNPL